MTGTINHRSSQRDHAIVVMTVGDHYEKLFETVRAQFERYAEMCAADLIVVREPPDPLNRRNILCQKMLLPGIYRNWEKIAILDIDILISPTARSIFEALPNGVGLAAVVDPRESRAFKNVVKYLWKLPEILDETHESYFSSRGFPPFPADTPVIGSINGGALLCCPDLVGDLFSTAYRSNFRKQATGEGIVDRKVEIVEEALMAYHSQANKLFTPLCDRYNHQFLFSLMDDPTSATVRWHGSLPYRVLRRVDMRIVVPPLIYQSAWRNLVRETLSRVDILHFSGGFPFRGFA